MNTSIMHASDNESVRPLSNYERILVWRNKAKDAMQQVPRRHLWRHEKPRIKVTVPAPLSNSEPAHSGEDL